MNLRARLARIEGRHRAKRIDFKEVYAEVDRLAREGYSVLEDPSIPDDPSICTGVMWMLAETKRLERLREQMESKP